MSIDTQYYNLYTAGLETCLSCPLAKCIWDMDEPDRSLCPIEQIDLNNSPLWQRNRDKIAGILDRHTDGVSLHFLSRKTGISHQMLAKWARRGGAFDYELVPRPAGKRGPRVYRIYGLAG